MIAGVFAKPCEFVASVWWGWDDETKTITHLCLETDAYAIGDRDPWQYYRRRKVYRRKNIRNRPADIA